MALLIYHLKIEKIHSVERHFRSDSFLQIRLSSYSIFILNKSIY